MIPSYVLDVEKRIMEEYEFKWRMFTEEDEKKFEALLEEQEKNCGFMYILTNEKIERIKVSHIRESRNEKQIIIKFLSDDMPDFYDIPFEHMHLISSQDKKLEAMELKRILNRIDEGLKVREGMTLSELLAKVGIIEKENPQWLI